MLGSFFELTEIPFPVQAKIQACIEDRRRIERHRLPLGRVAGIGTGAVGSYIVARRTTVCVAVRQAPVTEQSLSEQQTLWVLGRRGGDRRDRLEVGAGLEGWRLSSRRRGGVEANERQQEIRDPAPAYGRSQCRRHR